MSLREIFYCDYCNKIIPEKEALNNKVKLEFNRFDLIEFHLCNHCYFSVSFKSARKVILKKFEK